MGHAVYVGEQVKWLVQLAARAAAARCRPTFAAATNLGAGDMKERFPTIAENSSRDLIRRLNPATFLALVRSALAGRPTVVKAVLSIIDQVIVSGTSFVTAVIVGRAASPDLLGRYYLTLTVAFVLLGLQENLVSGPYTVLSARRRGRDLAEFTGSAWLLLATLIGASALLVAGAVGATSVAERPGSIAGSWALVGVLPLLLLREAIRRFAFARLEMATAVTLDSAVSMLQLMGLLLIWYVGRMSLFNIFAVMGVACGLSCAGWFILQPPSMRLVRRRVLSDWRENWSFARWALLSYAIVDTIPFAMPWFVYLAGGSAASGTFGACTTLIGVMNVFVGGMGNFLRPKAAESFINQGTAGLSRVLIHAAWIFIAVFGSICLVIAATGDALAVLIFGEAFSGTGGILLSLAVGVLIGSLGWIAANGLWAIGQLRASFVADVSMLLATVASAAALVGRFGPLGAALATLIGMVVGAALKTATLYLAMKSLRQTAAANFSSQWIEPLAVAATERSQVPAVADSMNSR
jgi:O-antigen/teichoic acid export membrane protein